MLFVDEESWRARRSHPHGLADLRQNIHLSMNHKTMMDIPAKPWDVHGGSTRSNVMGPVCLDPLDEIPMMSVADKIQYWGTRRVSPGGRADDDEILEAGADDDEGSMTL